MTDPNQPVPVDAPPHSVEHARQVAYNALASAGYTVTGAEPGIIQLATPQDADLTLSMVIYQVR